MIPCLLTKLTDEGFNLDRIISYVSGITIAVILFSIYLVLLFIKKCAGSENTDN